MTEPQPLRIVYDKAVKRGDYSCYVEWKRRADGVLEIVRVLHVAPDTTLSQDK